MFYEGPGGGDVSGRTEELEAFCRREYPRLVGALDLYLGDLHVAEELAQEALVRASKRWERVRTLESPGGWTYRVALNLANSWFRRRRAESRAYERVVGDVGTYRDAHVDVDVPERQAVRDAVRALPDRQRTALILRYYLDLPATEVAERMGTTHGAVRALTKRAVARLRETLGPDVIRIDLEEAHDVA